MDSTTIGRLRESVSLLPLEDLGPVHEFYIRLFELAPDTRTLFTVQIDLQARKFSNMLAQGSNYNFCFFAPHFDRHGEA